MTRFGLLVPHFGLEADQDLLIEGARLADRLGFDSLWVRDHLAVSIREFNLDQHTRSSGQRAQKNPLRAMLELDGISTETGSAINGIRVPLIAKHNGRSIAVCVTHSLVAEHYRTGLVDDLDGSTVPLRPLNAYQLTRNLPSCHLAIRKCLGLRPS